MQTSTKKITNIDQYIKTFPEEVQKILEKIRKIIRKEAPQAKETIKYQIPTFTLKRNLVHFAGFKKHIGFYPTPGAIIQFKEELSEYKQWKWSIQFSINKPIPYDIIKKMVRYRVQEESK